MKESIALIGMMGVGKSTVGMKLADSLGMRFVDSDELVSYQYAPVAKLFELFGEEGFRKYESRVIKQVSTYSDTVLATGGGVPLSEKNMELLAKNYNIVYLKATAPTIISRVSSSERDFPLLSEDDPEKDIRKIMNTRKDIYTKYADVTVSTDRKSIDKICDEIVKKLSRLYE